MQNFLRILKAALLVNLFISLVLGVSALFTEREPFYSLSIGILLFGSLFFPLLVASGLHFFVWKNVGYEVSVRSFLLYYLVLFASSQIILLIWSAIEVIWDFSLQNVVKHYNQEFGKMLWLIGLIAFAIPLVYLISDKQKRPKGNKTY